MPNHCANDLRINGSKKDIEHFFKAVKNGELLIDASKIIPYPKKYEEMDLKAKTWREQNPQKSWADGPKDGYNQGGYNWCISNWGTKWGLYDFLPIKYGKTFATISFYSAWSPPLPLILKASNLFPNILFTLKYYESGMCFKGALKVKAGETLFKSQTTYSGKRGG